MAAEVQPVAMEYTGRSGMGHSKLSQRRLGRYHYVYTSPILMQLAVQTIKI
jgi:hypothetical protein